MHTNVNDQHRPRRSARGHNPYHNARPVNGGDDGRWNLEVLGASPELGTAPWWADDANVDGCEITLRGRS